MKKTVKKQKESSGGLPYFLFFLFSVAAGIVLSVLCLYTSKKNFILKNRRLLSIIIAILWLGVYVFSILFLRRGNEKILRSLIAFYVLLLFVLLFVYIGHKTGFFQLLKNPDALQEFLKRAGWWMPFCYILLQYFQVTVLPIPSIVSTLVGVALFGAWQATLYSFIGIFLGSLTAFFLGRKLGKKTVSWIVGKESLDKWQKKLKGKDKFLLTSMFLLPLFPDDILCFIAGLSTMTSRYFIIMIAITRLVAIIASCYSFEWIPFNTWWGVFIWLILILVLLATCVLVYKNMDKLNEKIFKKKQNKKNK